MTTLFFNIDSAGRLVCIDHNEPLRVYARLSTFDTFVEFMKEIPDGVRVYCSSRINPYLAHEFTQNEDVKQMIFTLWRLFERFPDSTQQIVADALERMRKE